MKLLEENVGRTLQHIGLGDAFLANTPPSQNTDNKADEMNK